MSLVDLNPGSKRRVDMQAGLIFLISAVLGVVGLGPSLGVRATCVYLGSLLLFMAWVVLIARSHVILLDPARRMIVVQRRNALLMRRRKELSLERFSHVTSYHPFGSSPKIVVAMVEKSGDRELVVDQFPAYYKRGGFWSPLKIVEGEDARLLRTGVCRKTGLADGGYRGPRACARLAASERAS